MCRFFKREGKIYQPGEKVFLPYEKKLFTYGEKEEGKYLYNIRWENRESPFWRKKIKKLSLLDFSSFIEGKQEFFPKEEAYFLIGVSSSSFFIFTVPASSPIIEVHPRMPYCISWKDKGVFFSGRIPPYYRDFYTNQRKLL